ncbi:hypothetical protein TL16_g00065 [Triparma laevis f. inornata]|uniref:Uncharacterized protein n=2 Tax=Triparma laevis TaxID=1534972 RepID=A0A9W7CK78_9STRA|nr:hypothetical protein TL16_g00065 [Triparma laevis f. inornata]GMI07746.1 hypothetical protein TrLO_g11540 [Triparma laevis f. longispina]
MCAASLTKANFEYTWLLVCIHSTQVPFVARFLQFMSPTLDIVAMEVVLLFLELLETSELLEGRTLIDWNIMWAKRIWKKCIKQNSTIGDEIALEAAHKKAVDLKYKRREHLFGAIVTTNTISEISAILISSMTDLDAGH